jgi:hypothetical protein
LDTPEFRQAWSEWEQHRQEMGKSKALTPTAIKQQFVTCEEMGVDRAIAMIRFSIGKGWQGLFEEKANGRSSNHGSQGDRRRAQDYSPELADELYGTNNHDTPNP